MYAKLFSSLYQGTLRGRSDELLVFTNLLAFCDQHGFVDKHWQAIADETGLTPERVKAAIISLESPDSESRSPEMDGCRITRMDEHRAWGWQVTNYGKYRAIRNEDDRREQNRLAQQRWRERNKQGSKQSNTNKPRSAQEEGEGEGEGEGIKTKAKSMVATAPDWLPSIWDEYEQHRIEKKQKLTPTAKKAAINKLKAWRDQGHDISAIISQSIENGWTGLFLKNGKTHGRIPAETPSQRAARLYGRQEKDITNG